MNIKLALTRMFYVFFTLVLFNLGGVKAACDCGCIICEKFPSYDVVGRFDGVCATVSDKDPKEYINLCNKTYSGCEKSCVFEWQKSGIGECPRDNKCNTEIEVD